MIIFHHHVSIKTISSIFQFVFNYMVLFVFLVNSVPVDSTNSFRNKPKERCKYHPNCTKSFCEYYHPTSACKSFPNCKFADKCLYSHPRCKYDLACVNLDCNFSHSGPRSASLLEPTAPPLCKYHRIQILYGKCI